MSHGQFNDIVALFHQMSNQQTQDMELNLNGRIIEYDPKAHMCRAIIDTRRAEDEDGKPLAMETGWMQMNSTQVGDGTGDQYYPEGGAAVDNEKGEAIKVSLEHRHSGLAAVASLTFTDEQKPPGAGENGEKGDDDDDNATDDDDHKLQLRPGERIIKGAGEASAKFYKNGDLGIRSPRDIVLHLNVKGNLTINLTEGDVVINNEKGNYQLNLAEGDAEMNLTKGNAKIAVADGDIEAKADFGNVNVEATVGDATVTAGGIANIVAPMVNIISGFINAGVGMVQKLCNEAFLELFNLHIHSAPGGVTGPPTNSAIPGVETTIDLEAS